MGSFIEGFEKQAGLGAAKRLFRGFGRPKNFKQVMRGYERAAAEAGPESFLADTVSLFLPKKVKESIKRNTWKYVSKPTMLADVHAGEAMRKIPGMRGLFTLKEKVPLGEGLHKEVERASALAPLVKIRNIAVPIVAGIGIEKGIKDISEKIKARRTNPSGDYGMMNTDFQKASQAIYDVSLREKIASTMLQLHEQNKGHEKRAQAVKLLYKQAELGLTAIPTTYGEFEQKIASLVGQDLAVLEKALELTAGDVKLGELSGSEPDKRDAVATFQADVLSY
jgi:hypothetical protein